MKSLATFVVDLRTGMLAYVGTTSVVIGGVLFGSEAVTPGPDAATSAHGLIPSMSRFDGRNYVQIAVEGYAYDSSQASIVAFFPAFPLAGRILGWATGVHHAALLIIVAHICLATSFVVFATYARIQNDGRRTADRTWALMALGLWPAGLFLRMSYSESLFLLETVIVLLGIRQAWPSWAIGILAGAATGTRPVGVAVAAAVCAYTVSIPGTIGERIRRLAIVGPLSIWGLVAYMTYLYSEFKEPFAFALTQRYFTDAAIQDVPLRERLGALVTLEPIMHLYDPESPKHWTIVDRLCNPLFSMAFWNPIIFVAAVLLLVIGGWNRWLTRTEIFLGLMLLAIPYLTRAYEMTMGSHARFTVVVVPIYVVLGRLLSKWTLITSACLVALAAFFLGVWSALFAAGYYFF